MSKPSKLRRLATISAMSASCMEPVPPYTKANPYRNMAVAIAPKKKYLTEASAPRRPARPMTTMT